MEGYEFIEEARTVITHWKGSYRGIICRIDKYDSCDNKPVTFKWTAGLRGQGTANFYHDCIASIKHTIDMSKQHEEEAGYFHKGEY
jgi:hypothetical protein